ncbi:MAG TPA: gamma-glutamyltransferase, partial [Gammaproteobacteria bacterium]|nr:gamma-glutamyltransferase [Gammaproteobacteria bacterium]
KKLVDGVRKAGGIWTLKDLHAYQVVERSPIVGHYRGIRVVSASPPSSGGVTLVEMLNILSGYHLQRVSKVERDHLVIEAMRHAYRDRNEYLGDPGFVNMPLERLLSPDYAAGIRANISLKHALPSKYLPGVVEHHAHPVHHTTHFSVIDAQGNRVAATMSVNYLFGCGYVAPGTGVVLNDEMDDFASKPGKPNVYGLVQGDANAIAPGKRPLSSMTPTFLVGPHRIAILGTPGGSRIISMVLLSTLTFANGGGAHAMVSRPRFHNQYLPDYTEYEPGALSKKVMDALSKMGHHFHDVGRRYGNMQVVVWDRKAHKVQAASDPRGIGEAKVEAPGASH